MLTVQITDEMNLPTDDQDVSWNDYVINTVVETTEGPGIVVSLDSIEKFIGVSINGKGILKLEPNNVQYKFGTIHPSLAMDIGTFILLFQQMETYSKYMLKNINENTVADNKTAGGLLILLNQTIIEIIKDHDEMKETWIELKEKFDTLNSIRDTIVHGRRIEFLGPLEAFVDARHAFLNLKTKKEIKLKRNDIYKLQGDVQDLYYQLMDLFNNILRLKKSNRH